MSTPGVPPCLPNQPDCTGVEPSRHCGPLLLDEGDDGERDGNDERLEVRPWSWFVMLVVFIEELVTPPITTWRSEVEMRWSLIMRR